MTARDHSLSGRGTRHVYRDHADEQIPLDLLQMTYGATLTRKLDDGRVEEDFPGLGGVEVYFEGESSRRSGFPKNLGFYSPVPLVVTTPDGVRAVFDDTKADNDLKPKADKFGEPLPPLAERKPDEVRNVFGHPIAYGADGLILPGSLQRGWADFFLPCMELVAHHDYGTKDGPAPECSTRVYDLNSEGALDYDHAGALNSIFWVAALPNGGPLGMAGDWVAALNLARSRGDATGYGAYVYDGPSEQGSGIGAFSSHLASGPNFPGVTNDKHSFGQGPEGTSWNSDHNHTDGYFFMDEVRDAPVRFETLPWPHPVSFPIASKVHLVYRKDMQHPWVGGPREGMWDFYTTVPIRQPYIETPPHSPPFTPTDTPQYKRLPPVDGGGGGGGGTVTTKVTEKNDGQPMLGDGPNPFPTGSTLNTNKTRIDPARTPYELAMPSLFFFPVRRASTMPYDGRFGGAPVDNGPDSRGGPWAPTGIAKRGGRAPQQLPHAYTAIAQDGIPIKPTDGIGSSSETFSGPLGFQNRATEWKKRQGVAWTEKPLGTHFQCFGKESAGQWSTNESPGDRYLSGTVDSSLWIGPPEFLLDGEAPASVSKSALMLFGGNIGSTNFSGKAATLAWGQEDWATGQPTDGPYMQSTGATGVVNLNVGFLNAAAAARNGTLSLAGLLVGSSTGANIGMGKRTITAIGAVDGTTTLTVGTSNQSQRFTFAAEVAAATPHAYTIDLAATGAVQGSTFLIDVELAIGIVGSLTTLTITDNGGSTLLTITMATSGAIKRGIVAHFDGTNWTLPFAFANLT